MNNTQQLENVTLPRQLFRTMLEAYQKWEEFSDDLEDFLLSSDKTFLAKMRKARQEHKMEKTRTLAALKKEL